MLGALPRLPVPEELTTRLRIAGSREALRHRKFGSAGAFGAYLKDEVAVRFDHWFRPVFAPAAGGLLSAMLLFTMIAPALTVNRLPGSDVPSALTTQASLESSFSMTFSPVDIIVVDVFIDETGKVVDYSLPEGQNWAKNPKLIRSLETTLMYTKFTPATYFGQPSAARARITLQRNQVEVRG
ncbi:MAG: hypothetical protein FJW39_24040 [Acidobacteria bacterium]|nr:hypothetical protein [Acidobacteriota bacterium]